MSGALAPTAVLGTVEALWRYPVKSLQREALHEARFEPHGIEGDRARALYVVRGKARVGKAYRGKENNVLHTLADEGRARDVASDDGYDVEARDADDGHDFDAAPISLVLSNWLDEVATALGTPLDVQRWRSNVFVRARPEISIPETALVGRALTLGGCTLRVRSTIGRCVTTTYDVETGERNPAVLAYVARERDNVFGVYCDVEVAGVVRSGDVLRFRDR